MPYGLTKSSVSGHRAPHRAAMRVACGIGALLVTAAMVGVVGVSPASADSHSGSHVLKPRTHGAPAVSNLLIDHGGPVESAPVVYIDFWGWVSDPSGEQPYLTDFLSSVGGSSWLATVNQYGGGSNVRLAGTWSDPAGLPPSPSDDQIQAEAANAAAHFGAGNSVNVQIVVATPTGHSTPGFGTQWCGYHGAVASDPNITYTNLPYMTDAGASCGEGSVNFPGTLDGVSLVESGRLAESITDPLLDAWYDINGSEIAGKCPWGTKPDTVNGFPVAPLWSNAIRGCV